MQIGRGMSQKDGLLLVIAPLYGAILLHGEVKSSLWLQEVVQKLNLEHLLSACMKV